MNNNKKLIKLRLAESLAYDFIYAWADCKYTEQDLFKLVKKWHRKINPQSRKIRKKVFQLERIFENATYNFDLPEHEEKHNGYFEAYKYRKDVLI